MKNFLLCWFAAASHCGEDAGHVSDSLCRTRFQWQVSHFLFLAVFDIGFVAGLELRAVRVQQQQPVAINKGTCAFPAVAWYAAITASATCASGAVVTLAVAASTFACRVTAGTRSDIYSCICSGIGTLKGPLHGGANEAALEMLLPLTSIGKAKRWVILPLYLCCCFSGCC